MKNTVLNLNLCVLALAAGCVHTNQSPRLTDEGTETCYIQHGADFVIQGDVRDAETGKPVPYARVDFIDTGLDYHYGNEARSKRAGTANRDGRIDQRIHYGWCIETSFDALGVEPTDLSEVPPDERPDVRLNALLAALDQADFPQRFTIKVRSGGYAPHRAEFDLRALSEVEDGYEVNLGAITLVPQREETLGNNVDVDSIRLEP